MQGQEENIQQFQSKDQSWSSQQDENACLLTNKVQRKLLSVVAKLKKKDPSLLKTQKPIFQDQDFQSSQTQQQVNRQTQKYTYNQMMKEKQKNKIQKQDYQKEGQQQLSQAQAQKKAKQMFKSAIKTIKDQNQQLFKVKKKDIKEKKQQTEEQKFESLINSFKKKSNKQETKLIKQFWGKNSNLDQTDLFLKKYILDKKWLSHHNNFNNQKQQVIDEQDQKRSVEMDQYQQQYNFRFQEPNGLQITHFPRKIQQSLRVKPETRKERRKNALQKKKQQKKKLIQEAKNRQKEIKDALIKKINQNKEQKQLQEQVSHDWFFCDDCGKGLEDFEEYYGCNQCEDYILCQSCFDLIIHKHSMEKKQIQEGFGAPTNQYSKKILQSLKTCITCRRKIPTSWDRYQYTDRNYLCNTMCQKCYDSATLEIKKKYKLVQQEKTLEEDNLEEMLEENPQKVKQALGQEEIQEMVDQYIKCNFQDVLSGGLRTKFKYISVKPESYGLTDEQLLLGSEKQLNNYVSVKKLAPYRQGSMKLRNSVYSQKIKSIKKTVKQNKKQLLLNKSSNLLKRIKASSLNVKRMRLKNKERQRLKIINLSNPQVEKKQFINQNRLTSYGLKKQ